jgi:hypothetical protein
MEIQMFLMLFTSTLAAVWLAFVLVAFCPMRANRRRQEVEECEDV